MRNSLLSRCFSLFPFLFYTGSTDEFLVIAQSIAAASSQANESILWAAYKKTRKKLFRGPIRMILLAAGRKEEPRTRNRIARELLFFVLFFLVRQAAHLGNDFSSPIFHLLFIFNFGNRILGFLFFSF